MQTIEVVELRQRHSDENANTSLLQSERCELGNHQWGVIFVLCSGNIDSGFTFN